MSHPTQAEIQESFERIWQKSASYPECEEDWVIVSNAIKSAEAAAECEKEMFRVLAENVVLISKVKKVKEALDAITASDGAPNAIQKLVRDVLEELK